MSGALWSGIVDVNAPALVTVGVTHTWRDVITHAQTPPHIDRHPHARHDRVGVVGATSVELAMALTAMVHHGLTPVLGHPRWPLALRTAAFARAGVGGPRPASWRPWIDDADSGTVVFTSGSTGVPKAVLHSVAAHRENAAGAHAVMPFGPGDRWLVSLPLCHVGGLALVFRALHAGGALAFPEPGQPLTDALVALRPSHISVVAAQLRQILADPAATAVARAARVVLVGGGPTPAALFAIAVAAGVPVRQTWGLTEMGSQVCTSDALRTATCGVALPGRHVRIADDGELLVGGAPRCIGFVDGWDLQRPFNDAGDYATRDLGVMTAAGLVITGRKDNQFISGGENIQPEAIEAVLSDERVSVVVVPVADEKFGYRPCAFFDASSAMDGGDGADVDATIELLRRRAVDQLPRFMMPVAWLPMPPFAGLKPSRAALTALATTTLASTSTTSTPSPTSPT
jgi:O-succinylbenzoic acid--CoA ligase